MFPEELYEALAEWRDELIAEVEIYRQHGATTGDEALAREASYHRRLLDEVLLRLGSLERIVKQLDEAYHGGPFSKAWEPPSNGSEVLDALQDIRKLVHNLKQSEEGGRKVREWYGLGKGKGREHDGE